MTDKLREALAEIVALDPVKDSDEGYNEWGEADCFGQAQKIAREALASATPAQADDNTTEDFLSDVYNQCCEAIKPYVDRNLLPGSVVESLQILVERFAATPASQTTAEGAARLVGRSAIVDAWKNLPPLLRLDPALGRLWEAVMACDDATTEQQAGVKGDEE